MTDGKLSLKVKLGFGVCDLGGNLFFTAIAFLLLNFLTDTVGIEAGLAGVIIMIGKVWDAVMDPTAGFLSDRTRSAMGRRRPWMLWGSVPLFIAMAVMFTNPSLFFGAGWDPANHQVLLFAWGTAVFCILNTAYAAVNIPYTSLTPELTTDYHERTALNGYRFGFAVIGTLLGAGAALPIVGLFPDKNTGFVALGTLFGFLMMITALITVVAVREPRLTQGFPTEGFFETYLRVFKNRPYVQIALTYTFHIIAITLVSGIAIYYFKYIHNDEALTTIALLVLLVTAMLFIPVSVLLSQRIGKKLVYGIGLAFIAVTQMVLYFLGHLYPPSFSFAVMFFMGIGFGFTYALPYAMVPDAIEYDYLLTGLRKEGAFYGMWVFCIKIGQAVALGITGLVLSLTGYILPVAKQAVAQPDSAQWGIRLLLGPIPAVMFVIAIVFLYYYPINEKRYNEILDEIKAKEGGR